MKHTAKPDSERGLYRKFRVMRTGKARKKHLGCSFFVLDLFKLVRRCAETFRLPTPEAM